MVPSYKQNQTAPKQFLRYATHIDGMSNRNKKFLFFLSHCFTSLKFIICKGYCVTRKLQRVFLNNFLIFPALFSPKKCRDTYRNTTVIPQLLLESDKNIIFKSKKSVIRVLLSSRRRVAFGRSGDFLVHATCYINICV